MRYINRIFLFGILVLSTSTLMAQTLAFPSAEGFGKYAKGGRSGDVYHVINLSDAGVGSLRYGVESMVGPRTIVFDVSGTIMLNDRLKIDRPNLTIAGQTAPGDGITIGGGMLKIQASDIIIRYIRVRLGDQSGDDDDAITITEGSNIIVDHVTASWSIDETFSCQSDEVDLLTVQWCFVSESLLDSHHEKGRHGYGGIIGSLRQTFHHNIYAHHSSRSPKVTWRQHTEVDFRNNVIYNWGYNNCYDGTSSYLNWVNNYYKAGPATKSDVRDRIFELSDEDKGDFASFETSLHAEGNYVDGYPLITEDNWRGGIDFEDGANESDHRKPTPHDFVPIADTTAIAAYPIVLANAGASLVRDTIDKRIVHETINGTTTYLGSKTGNEYPGLIDSQNDVGGWPELIEEQRDTTFDKDADGMADAWELENNLDPNNADDRNEISNTEGYTNLELYLNSLVKFYPPVYIPEDTTSSNVNSYQEIKLKSYPNPASSTFTIDLSNIREPNLKIYNSYGQMVNGQDVNQGSNTIKCESLKPGLYFVKVTDNLNRIYTEKIIIK